MSARVVEIKSYGPCFMSDGVAEAMVGLILKDEAWLIEHHLDEALMGDDRISRTTKIAEAWLNADIFDFEKADIFKMLRESDANALRDKCNQVAQRWQERHGKESRQVSNGT